MFYSIKEQLSINSSQAFNQRETWGEYGGSIVRNMFTKKTVRGKQARLTLLESLELFDLLNDFVFGWRVYSVAFGGPIEDELPEQRAISQNAALSLACIYFNALTAFCTRSWWCYHRIPAADFNFFFPLASLYKIREAEQTQQSLISLFMFERVVWTYQFAMRFIEDVPQVIYSGIFLANNKKDVYTFFMIAYSAILLIVTSYRLGSEYPLLRTMTLCFCRRPPIDSPVLQEAAPVTRNFAKLLCFCFTTWACAQLTISKIPNLPPHWVLAAQVLASCSGLAAVVCLVYLLVWSWAVPSRGAAYHSIANTDIELGRGTVS